MLCHDAVLEAPRHSGSKELNRQCQNLETLNSTLQQVPQLPAQWNQWKRENHTPQARKEPREDLMSYDEVKTTTKAHHRKIWQLNHSAHKFPNDQYDKSGSKSSRIFQYVLEFLNFLFTPTFCGSGCE